MGSVLTHFGAASLGAALVAGIAMGREPTWFFLGAAGAVFLLIGTALLNDERKR